MGKLIDSDWLRAQWDEPTDWMDGDQILHHYTWYKTMIDVAPTVDAVPVVRCKDCKWCSMGECEHKLGLIVANDENYCSYGERKGGDHHD